MKVIPFPLISLLAFAMMIATGCIKDSHAREGDICDSNRRTVMTVNDLTGRLSYSNELEKWVINAPIPGTIDGLRTGIICGDISGDLKIHGLSVIFSGELKDSNGYPKPQLGGQEIYYVRPTKMKKA